MKIHEKAKLYDELLEDYQSFVNEIKAFKSNLESISKTEDSDPDRKRAKMVGKYEAQPYGLDLILGKHLKNCELYENLK